MFLALGNGTISNSKRYSGDEMVHSGASTVHVRRSGRWKDRLLASCRQAGAEKAIPEDSHCIAVEHAQNSRAVTKREKLRHGPNVVLRHNHRQKSVCHFHF